MFVANHVVRQEKYLCSLLNIDSVCIIVPGTGKNVTTYETFQWCYQVLCVNIG